MTDLEKCDAKTTKCDCVFVPQRRRQIFAAAVATIGSFGLGTVLVWSAPALPDLINSGDLGDISPDEKSWIGSIALLGALISAPAAGFLMSNFGRKLSMILMAIPFVIGWGLIAFASNVPMIYVGRVLTGFAGGAYTVFVPVYVAETADPRIRGALSTLMILMLVTGVLFTFVVGTFASWSVLSAICGLAPLLLIVLMPFAPETPRYLVSKKKIRKAIKSLLWLRGASDLSQVKDELEEIQENVQIDKEDSARWRDLFISSSIKPTLVSSALFLFQQMSGANAVSFYTLEVFQAAGTNVNANLASIIVAICQMLTVLIPTFLVDRVGRKTLLLVSEAIMAVSLVGLGVFFYFKENQHLETTEMLSWLPLVCFISFIIGYNVGMGPIPWVVTSEILPSQSRALATSVVTSFYWILSFLVAKTFHSMSEALGWTLSYALFALVCVGGAIFIIFLVPETKGKSATDIELIYKRPSTIRRASLRQTTGIRHRENPHANKGVENYSFQMESC